MRPYSERYPFQKPLDLRKVLLSVDPTYFYIFYFYIFLYFFCFYLKVAIFAMHFRVQSNRTELFFFIYLQFTRYFFFLARRQAIQQLRLKDEKTVSSASAIQLKLSSYNQLPPVSNYTKDIRPIGELCLVLPRSRTCYFQIYFFCKINVSQIASDHATI